MGFLSRFREQTKRVTLPLLLAGAAWSAAPRVEAAEPVGEQQLITVIPSGGGVGGSRWLGEVILANPSLSEEAYGRLVLFAQNRSGSDDGPSLPYSLPPRTTLRVLDPVAQIGASGNMAVKVIPENHVTPSVTAMYWNEQELDGDPATKTKLNQLTAAVPLSQLLLRGDEATFAGPDTTIGVSREAFRWNCFFYGETDSTAPVGQQEPRLFADLFTGTSGGYIKTVTLTMPDHGAMQKTDFIRTVFEVEPRPYDHVKMRVTGGRVWAECSYVQNNEELPGVDDGGVQKPGIRRLMESGVYTVAPTTVEANDPVVRHLRVLSRPGTRVDGCTFRGGWETTIHGDGTNVYEHNVTTYPTMPGTYDVYAVCGFSTLDGGFLGARTLPAGRLTVEAEPADYTPANSYVKTQTNLETLATLIGGNINTVFINTMMHYNGDEIRNVLQVYTNGTTGPSDPELERVIIKEGTNSVDFRRTDGGTAVWAGFTETQMRSLRELYKD